MKTGFNRSYFSSICESQLKIEILIDSKQVFYLFSQSFKFEKKTDCNVMMIMAA